MALVGYSDSEGSDAEETPKVVSKPAAKPPTLTNFAVDKANPKKIRVNLNETLPSPAAREDGEPAPKRARVGGGAFSGFNAMLPAPKRDNEKAAALASNANRPARKVFSLKTGAEPAFNREADAEMKELFAQQEEKSDSIENTISSTLPKPSFISDPARPTSTQGKPLMFKPLSVARNNKKKKPASQLLAATPLHPDSPPTHQTSPAPKPSDPTPPPKQKINLFSSGPTTLPPDPEEDDDPPHESIQGDDTASYPSEPTTTTPLPPPSQPTTLSSLATTLNLTPSERRQLLGRNATSAHSTNIITFNTETEYAANQAHIAAGEQVQHNPVKAIAPGKHSLKSLVASAQGQKEALEESFAQGRKNKKEVGSRYGW